VESFQVEEQTDGDGNPVWRHTALLRNGKGVGLSELWSHDHLGIDEAARIMSQACGLASLPRPEMLGPRGQKDG